MINSAPSTGRLTRAVLCLAVGGVGSFLFSACSHVTSKSSEIVAPSVEKSAHLTMINGSDCEWRIVITADAGGARRSWILGVTKSIDVDLTAGDYAVEQTLVAGGGAQEMTRNFPLRLEAGQVYGWRLITLLSGTSGDVRLPVPVNSSHE